MAMIYSNSIRNLLLGRGILAVFANPCAISVYSGAQPTSSNITASWPTYNSDAPNFLAHFNGAAWTQPSNSVLLQLTIPPAATALNSGTASWAILWATNVAPGAVSGQVGGTTLPSPNFIVVPCSNGTGIGVIRFNNTSIAALSSVTILDGSIGATF